MLVFGVPVRYGAGNSRLALGHGCRESTKCALDMIAPAMTMGLSCRAPTTVHYSREVNEPQMKSYVPDR